MEGTLIPRYTKICGISAIAHKNMCSPRNMKLWLMSGPLMSRQKTCKYFPRPFPMQTLQRTITRVGTTPALALQSASSELARPIHRSIMRHSAIQVVTQKCPWPPDPAPCHSVLKTRINSQLVWSTSESLATVSVIVPTRVTIAVQPSLANGSHIARSHTFREKATRYLRIAVQPRHVEAPQLAGMGSNNLGYDLTAQSRQHSVAATRYLLSSIR